MVDTARSLHPVDRERLPIKGVISATFRIFGKAPLAFLLFGFASQLMVLGRLIVVPPTKPNFNLAATISLVGTLLLGVLLQTAVTSSALRLYNRQPASTGAALSLGVRRYLPMIGTVLLYLLAVYAGLLLLIVPGVIASLLFAVAVPVCAVEAAGPIASFKRSIFLTRGERWRILGVYCLFFIPLLLVFVVIAVAFTLRGRLVGGALCSAAIQTVWVPLATIFSTIIYAELRRLNENVGVASIFD